MTDQNKDREDTIRSRSVDDPSTSPADHEAALQEQERQDQAAEQAKVDEQLAKDGPQGAQVNTPNLSASVVDGHDLSEHVEEDGRSVAGGTISPNGNDTTRTPGPGGNTKTTRTKTSTNK